LGRTVVHGSPTAGIKKIEPRKGSKAMPDDAVAFFWDPKGFRTRGDMGNNLTSYTTGKGSAYVGKVPRSAVKPKQKGIGYSDKPIKVKKEISATLPFMEFDKELRKALLKAGVLKKPTKQTPRNVVKKAEKVVRKSKKIDNAIYKRKTKGSIV
jgi:hypothetical protein